MSSKILFWNRRDSQVEEEQIYGDAFLRWIYETTLGQKLADKVLSHSFLSQLYGYYQSSRWSRRKIPSFIKNFHIPMEEFESGPFLTFNDFFIRKFKPGVRTFVPDPSQFPAFSEARYLGYEQVKPDQKFPVKGTTLSSSGLLLHLEWAKIFEGGPLLLARLCPTDYHRFHFPDSGKCVATYRIPGKLHSVNPIALRYKSEIFITNERQVSILETQNFGKIAHIEVGANCVGKIIQTFPLQKEFARGDEKGYFLFGASTIIVLGVAGAWKPDSDLIKQTALGRETLVQLGEPIASRA